MSTFRLSILTFLSLGMLLNAGEHRSYTCYRLAQAPALDGKIDDPAWQTIPTAAGFYIWKSANFAVEKPTTFKAGWTRDSLYLAIRCEETNPAKLKAIKKDGAVNNSNDSMEMFFLPDGAKEYFRLFANSAGARSNMKEDNANQKPWDWQAKASVGRDYWMLEVKIPFAVLQKTPADGNRWAFNIARHITTGPASESVTCWSPLKKEFIDLENFGVLIFKEASLAPQEVKDAENKLNADYQSWIQKKSVEIVQAVNSSEEFNRIFKDLTLQMEATPLHEALSRLEQISKQKEPACIELAGAVQACLSSMHGLEARAKVLGLNVGTLSIEKGPASQLQFEIKTKNATASLLVNGKAVDPNSKQLAAEISEGVSVIGVIAEAQGQDPGITVKIAGHPETDGRWRAGNSAETNWQISGFNDVKWPVAVLKPDGYMWSTNAADRKVLFRQIILWNQQHDGPHRCIEPLVREWGFSEDSVETIFLALYSPLPFPLDDHEIVFDVPECFRMLDVMSGNSGGGPKFIKPLKITEEKTRHAGASYRSYRLLHNAAHVPVDRTDATLMPLRMDKYTPYSWWDNVRGRDKTCRFYYRRQARGNFTELQNFLPVRILPPINGRMPKQVMISQYRSVVPYAYGNLSPEHLALSVQQAMRAGFNYWVSVRPPYNPQLHGDSAMDEYNLIVQGGGHVILRPHWDWPLNGDGVPGRKGIGQDLYNWLEAVPEARARYFQDSLSRTNNGMYCPSYVTTEGAEKFRGIVKKEYAGILAGMPAAEIIWTDWEGMSWAHGNPYGSAPDGSNSWCFCDRCKKGFRSFAKLPETAELSDEIIFKNYPEPWNEFRCELDGRVHGEIRQVCHELGRLYMFYAMTVQKKLWEACKDRIDLAFPGCPGNATADGGRQKHLDTTSKFFREKLGLTRFLGQRFSFFANFEKDGWKNWRVLSYDGYVNAKSWKPQIIRMTASTRGGLDLATVLECCAGMQYYIGEATRIISEYEPLFWDGERADDMAQSEQIEYPNLLVLKRGQERLVLLFNESDRPMNIVLNNKALQPDQRASLYGSDIKIHNPAKIEITLPPEDVSVVYIR